MIPQPKRAPRSLGLVMTEHQLGAASAAGRRTGGVFTGAGRAGLHVWGGPTSRHQAGSGPAAGGADSCAGRRVLSQRPAKPANGIAPVMRKATWKLWPRSTTPPISSMKPAPAREPSPPSRPAEVEMRLDETSDTNAR